jgi:hypothetical protein
MLERLSIPFPVDGVILPLFPPGYAVVIGTRVGIIALQCYEYCLLFTIKYSVPLCLISVLVIVIAFLKAVDTLLDLVLFQILSFFTLSSLHQFLDACMEH